VNKFCAYILLILLISCSSEGDDTPSSSSLDVGSSSSGPGGGLHGTATTFTDIRDNKIYKKVTIGTQTWMAENLNHDPGTGAVGISTCYNNNSANCVTYGRMYDWATANAACPSGWHLPSDAEWDVLVSYAGSSAGTKLKAKSGWSSGNGTDDQGFSALPGGFSNWDGSYGDFYSVNDEGYWWSATGNYSSTAWYRYIVHNYSDVYKDDGFKWALRSVRCVQNAP